MSNTLVKSASVILAVTLVGRLLGLIRDSFIASTYGLSLEADVYNWIAGILLTLYMVVPGALNAVYIPVMSKFLGEDHTQRRNQLFQRVWTVILFAFVGVTILLYLFAPQIISILQPGSSGEKLALTIQLFRLILPAVFMMGIIGLLMSVSYSQQQFFLPSFGTVILSVTVIISIFLLVPLYGIYGLTVGTVASYFFFAILLMWVTWRKKYPLTLSFGWQKDGDLRRMGELFFPILFGMAISQSYFFVNQALASTLADGAQAALLLAQKLYQLPPAIFVGAFTVPLLPILSDLVKKNQMEETKRILRKGMSYLHILMIPTMVAFIVIGDTFIRFVFERGEFTAVDTERTYWALLFLSLALFPMAVRDMITRTFYALEDTKTPVLIGLVSVGINFGVAMLFIQHLQHGAMALGYSVAIMFDMVLLVILLRRKIGSIFDSSYLVSLGKVFAAAIGMGTLLWGLDYGLSGMLSVYLLAPLHVGLGGAIYFLLLVLLREERIGEMQQVLLRKIRRT